MSRLDSLIAMFQKPFFRFNVPKCTSGYNNFNAGDSPAMSTWLLCRPFNQCSWWDFHSQVLCFGSNGGWSLDLASETKYLLVKSYQLHRLLWNENKSFWLAQMVVTNIPPQSEVYWHILHLAFFSISNKWAQQILWCNKLQYTFVWYISTTNNSNNCLQLIFI